MPRVSLKYYALLREQAGRGEEDVETSATDPAGLYDELARRRKAIEARGDKAWKPTEQRKRKITTALKAYAALATSASDGAVRDVSRLNGA